MWAKPMMPLLLMPVPQSLVENFVETLTLPDEAQNVFRILSKPMCCKIDIAE